MDEEAARKDRQADHDRIYAPDALPYVQAQEQVIRLDAEEKKLRQSGVPDEEFLYKKPEYTCDSE